MALIDYDSCAWANIFRMTTRAGKAGYKCVGGEGKIRCGLLDNCRTAPGSLTMEGEIG